MNSYVDLSSEQFLSWEHRKECPKPINYPSEYDGKADLRIACTQLGISASAQRKLVKEWSEFIPTLATVEHIWFYSRVPQALLDSVCSLPKLRSLFIKWSGNGIADLTKAGAIKSLERLYIGSCTQVESLSGLKNLPNLRWLEMSELKKIRDISDIECLTNLVGLRFTGGMFSKQCLDSIAPISNLQNLEYLDLHGLKVESGDISPIAELKNLRYLDLPIYYELSDFARIYASLPNCDHGIYAYRKTGTTCSKCGQGELVLPMAKRKRQLCLVCDDKKVSKLESEFMALVSSYS